MFMRAATGVSHETVGVRVINHYERLVWFGEMTDRGEVGNVTVHREYTVGRDHFEPGFAGFAEFDLEVLHVVVGVAQALRFAKPDAIDDAGVVKFVRDNGIFRSEQGLEQATVSIKARAIKDGVFHAQEFAEFGLELLMDALRAANEANTGHAVTPFVERFF